MIKTIESPIVNKELTILPVLAIAITAANNDHAVTSSKAAQAIEICPR